MHLHHHNLVLDAALVITIIAALWFLFDTKYEIATIVRCNAAKKSLKFIILRIIIEPKSHFIIPMRKSKVLLNNIVTCKSCNEGE